MTMTSVAPSLEELKEIVRTALNSFMDRDRYLIYADASERSITHRIAVHLTSHPRLKAWDIDCEYNRSGLKAKRLGLPPKQVSIEESVATTVFPDIIIHRRGASGPNLLVIEAKKKGLDTSFDESKLAAYRQELQYSYGLLLIVPNKPEDDFEEYWQT